MWSNNFSGSIIFFDDKEIVIIIPMTYCAAVFPREKLKDTELKIGGEVHAAATKEGYDLHCTFEKLKPGQEAMFEQLRDRYLELHKKEKKNVNS